MATRVFLGGAPAVPQQDEYTLGGTWLAADTITCTVNNKDLVLTLGSTVTLPTILDNLVVMLSGTGSFGTGYSANAYGSSLGEFAMLSYAEDGSAVLTVTGPADGRPFTFTMTKNSVGGTIGSDPGVVAGTGPYSADNAANYSGDTLPADGDTIELNERTCYSPKYGLNQSSITPAYIYVRPGVSRSITVGLNPTNTDNTSLPFAEYLPTMWTLGNSGDATPTTLVIENSNATMLRFNTGTGQTDVIVRATARARAGELPVFYWEGTHADNTFTLMSGDVGTDNSTIDLLTVSPTSVGNAADCRYQLGSNVTLASVRHIGGTGRIDSGSTLLEVAGGVLTVISGDHDETNVDGGVAYLEGDGTYATIRVGSSGDVRRTDDREATVTNAVQLYNGAKFQDNSGSFNRSGNLEIKLNRCKLAEVTLDIGPDRTVTIS